MWFVNDTKLRHIFLSPEFITSSSQCNTFNYLAFKCEVKGSAIDLHSWNKPQERQNQVEVTALLDSGISAVLLRTSLGFNASEIRRPSKSVRLTEQKLHTAIAGA